MADSNVLRDQSILPKGAGEALALRADSLGHIDIITAGFPCQPFSTAARGRNNARDLWPETFRVIRCVRPLWVVLENVPSYRLEHIEQACSDLESIGYAVWPLDIGVEVFRHIRRRVWVVAYAHGDREPHGPEYAQASCLQALSRLDHPTEPGGMGEDDGPAHRLDGDSRWK